MWCVCDCTKDAPIASRLFPHGHRPYERRSPPSEQGNRLHSTLHLRISQMSPPMRNGSHPQQAVRSGLRKVHRRRPWHSVLRGRKLGEPTTGHLVVKGSTVRSGPASGLPGRQWPASDGPATRVRGSACGPRRRRVLRSRTGLCRWLHSRGRLTVGPRGGSFELNKCQLALWLLRVSLGVGCLVPIDSSLITDHFHVNMQCL